MTIQEFKTITIEKEKMVWKEGKFLTNITYDNQVCDVYKLYDFYVSLSYDVANRLQVIIDSHVYPEMLPIIRSIHSGE